MSRKPEPSTSWIVATSTYASLYVLHEAEVAFLRHGQCRWSNIACRTRGVFGARRYYRWRTGIICDQTFVPGQASTPVRIRTNGH